ncbi:MAG: PDZ domain-containing protein [Thermoguttaceae bacterium]
MKRFSFVMATLIIGGATLVCPRIVSADGTPKMNESNKEAAAVPASHAAANSSANPTAHAAANSSANPTANNTDMYWIGVSVVPIPDLLLGQFCDDPKNCEGLLVIDSVIADAPAAKAGVEPGDVVLKMGDKKVTNLHELVKAVSEVKNQSSPMTVVRRGAKKELTVTPEKRPHEMEAKMNTGMIMPGHMIQAQQLNSAHTVPMQHQVMRMSPDIHISHPANQQTLMRNMEGMFRQMQGGTDGVDSTTIATESETLPSGDAMSIQVSSHTDQDGKTMIHVTKMTRIGNSVEKKTYQADKIENLPAEIRPDVEAFFGK